MDDFAMKAYDIFRILAHGPENSDCMWPFVTLQIRKKELPDEPLPGTQGAELNTMIYISYPFAEMA